MPRHGSRSHRSHGHSHHRHVGFGHRHHHHHHHSHYRSRPRIIIPTTNEYTIVFPYNFSSRKFNTQQFNPTMTNHKINVNEIESFFSELEPSLKLYHEAAGTRAVQILSWLILLFVIAVAVVVPISIVNLQAEPETVIRTGRTRYGSTYTYTDYIDKPFPIGIPIACGALFFYIIFYVCIRAHLSMKAEDKMNQLKPQIDAIVSQKGLWFQERGFMWKIPTHFPHWIELQNLEAMKNAGMNTALGAPPTGPGIQIISTGRAVNNSMSPLQMFVQPQSVQSQGYQQFQQDQYQYPQVQQQQQEQQQGIYMQSQFNGNTFNSQGW